MRASTSGKSKLAPLELIRLLCGGGVFLDARPDQFLKMLTGRHRFSTSAQFAALDRLSYLQTLAASEMLEGPKSWETKASTFPRRRTSSACSVAKFAGQANRCPGPGLMWNGSPCSLCHSRARSEYSRGGCCTRRQRFNIEASAGVGTMGRRATFDPASGIVSRDRD